MIKFARNLALIAGFAMLPWSVVGVAATEAGNCCLIPAGTTVEIAIDAPISSKTNKPGDTFPISLKAAIMVGNVIAVPEGTTGIGQVVHAAHSTGAGRPGELILAARYLDVDGVKLMLRSLNLGVTGTDRTAELTAQQFGFVLFGIAGAILTATSGSTEVDVPAGTRANARTASEAVVPALESAEPPKK